MENKIEKYVAPEVCVVECQVEKGYATTGGDYATFSIGTDVDEASTRNTPSWWFEDK